jgi:hypothetical protein
MNTQERVRQTLDDVTIRVTALKDRMKSLVAGFPDGPEGVTHLGSKCCSVPFSVLSQNKNILSADYYMTGDAKKALIKIIETSSLENIGDRIEQIIYSGSINPSTSCMVKYYHPKEKLCSEFIRTLAELWYGGV